MFHVKRVSSPFNFLKSFSHQLDPVLMVDVRVAMCIYLSVIVVCVVLGVAIVICCFSSSCPLYDTCSGGWSKGEPVQNPAQFFNGYVSAGDMHLNGGVSSDKKNHISSVQNPVVKVSEADHV